MSYKEEKIEGYKIKGIEVDEKGNYKVTIEKPDGTIVVVPPQN